MYSFWHSKGATVWLLLLVVWGQNVTLLKDSGILFPYCFLLELWLSQRFHHQSIWMERWTRDGLKFSKDLLPRVSVSSRLFGAACTGIASIYTHPLPLEPLRNHSKISVCWNNMPSSYTRQDLITRLFLCMKSLQQVTQQQQKVRIWWGSASNTFRSHQFGHFQSKAHVISNSQARGHQQIQGAYVQFGGINLACESLLLRKLLIQGWMKETFPRILVRFCFRSTWHIKLYSYSNYSKGNRSCIPNSNSTLWNRKDHPSKSPHGVWCKVYTLSCQNPFHFARAC